MVEIEVRYDNKKVKFLFQINWKNRSRNPSYNDCINISLKSISLSSNVMEEGVFDPHEYSMLLVLMMGKEMSFKVKAQPWLKHSDIQVSSKLKKISNEELDIQKCVPGTEA